ncbi:MAG: methyltransferase regulatory domain-containing protein [Rhodospirillales bacterium]
MAGGWTEGYLAEVDYSATLHRELAPINLALAATIKLVAAPPPERPYNFLELGCGYGVTTAALAAANPHATFHANDFNPAHIAQARRLAAEAGLANITYLEQSFAELRDVALPEFDFIALHGILSWVSADNVGHIVELIRRHLKPAGLCFISYNALPGWSAVAPLQRLLKMLSQQMAGGVLDRLAQSIVMVEQLKSAEARFFGFNPFASQWTDDFRKADPHYLAHEYLNEHWTAYYAADVHARMSEAKLTFVASAEQIENFRDDSLTPAMQRLLNDIPPGPLRETAFDFAVNRIFRRDVFARGVVAIDGREQRRILAESRFVLTRARSRCETEAKVPNATIRIDDPVFPVLLDVMAAGPQVLGALYEHPALAPFGREEVLRAMMVLLSINYAAIALPADGEAARRASAGRFNAAAVRRILDGKPPRALASPVLGNGVPIDPIDCFCLASRHHKGDPVDFVLDRIDATNQTVSKAGKVITDRGELRAEMMVRVTNTLAEGPAVLDALGIEI